MEKRRFGKTDMDVSVLGFGGAEIGYEETSTETVADLLNSALDAGLNVIDTAECYRGSEESIGKAVSNRRKDFYLFTKCGHPHGMESGANWSRDSILQSIERSLQRLKTDHLDLVQLHSCSETELRKGEVITALQAARKKVIPDTLVTAAIAGPRIMPWTAARSIRCKPRSTSPTRKRSN